MNNDSIKVVVDYMRGNYIVYGLYNGTIQPLVKPIRGIDRDGLFKDNYSNRMINNRKKQIRKDIRKILKADPDFKFSEKSIDQVDSVMYKTLQSWDLMAGTTYALNYLKTIIQDFKVMENQKESNKTFNEKCRQARKEQLNKFGIDISYNTAILNTDRSLTFFDKIKGILIAKKQKKYIDAKVNNSLILEDNYYSEDVERFIRSLRKKINNENKTAQVIKKENRERPSIMFNNEKSKPKFKSIKESPIGDLKFNNFEKHNKRLTFEPSDVEKTKKENQIRQNIIEEDEQTRLRVGNVIKSIKEDQIKQNIIEDDEETRLRVGKIIKSIKEDQIRQNIIEDDEETRLRVGNVIKSIKKDKVKEKEQRAMIIENAEEPPTTDKTKIKRWTRKFKNEKESIRNMKFKPINLNGKKRLIAGAISILAAGIVVVGINTTSFSSKNTYENFETRIIQTNGTETTDNLSIEEKNQHIIEFEENKNIENTILEKNKEDNKIVIEKNENTKINRKKEIKDFKKMALKRYNESMAIGEDLHIGDILEEQTYSENPDGTGNKGYFSQHANYTIGHISVITKEGWKVIDAKGKTLESILEENPEYETYNIHFVNGENGGGLGFITQNQYEELVENKIDQIVQNKTNNDINKSFEEELDR